MRWRTAVTERRRRHGVGTRRLAPGRSASTSHRPPSHVQQKARIMWWFGNGKHQRWPFIDHPRSSMVYNFEAVCLSVCLSVCISVCLLDDNFRKPLRSKFIFAHLVHRQGIQVKFVYHHHHYHLLTEHSSAAVRHM